MIALRDKDTGADLGTITEEQLQFLVDQLEEEYAEDRTTTSIARCSRLCNKTAPIRDWSTLLLKAIGDRDGIEIEWSEV